MDQKGSADLIPFMKGLGQKASASVDNPEFKDKHILMLGETHLCIRDENKSLHNPASTWLGDNFGEFKKAGYKTFAMEHPCDLDPDEWIEKSDNIVLLPNKEEKSFIENLKRNRNNIVRRIESRIDINDKNRKFIAFLDGILMNLINDFDEKDYSDVINSDREVEDDPVRWINLAKKAKEAGLRVVFTDAKRNVRWMNTVMTKIMKANLGDPYDAQLFLAYLLRKAAKISNLRDRTISRILQAALKEGSVLSLYGANHMRRHQVKDFPTAYQRLKGQDQPVVGVAMEFKGMKDHQIIAEHLSSNEPRIMDCDDLSFSSKANPKTNITTFYEGQIFPNQIHNFTVGQSKPFDAIAVFPSE